jgi:hypothetical protein
VDFISSVSNATSGFGNLMINKNTPKNRIFEKFSLGVENMIQETGWYDNTGNPYSTYPEPYTNSHSIQLSYSDY